MTRRALLVIDVQNEYETGRLPIAHPPVAGSLAQVGRAMDAATAAGQLVVVVQHDSPVTAPAFALGSHGWQLHPVVAARPADLVLHKTLPSAFARTDLEEWLRDRQVDTVTLVGYMTQHCVDSTAREAMHTGFAAEVLSDATGSPGYANEAGQVSAEELHRAHLVALHAGIAAVATTEEWLTALHDDVPLPLGSPLRSAAAAVDGAGASVVAT